MSRTLGEGGHCDAIRLSAECEAVEWKNGVAGSEVCRTGQRRVRLAGPAAGALPDGRAGTSGRLFRRLARPVMLYKGFLPADGELQLGLDTLL